MVGRTHSKVTIETQEVICRFLERFYRETGLLNEVQASRMSPLVVVHLRPELLVLPRQLLNHLRETRRSHLMRSLQFVVRGSVCHPQTAVVGILGVSNGQCWWYIADVW